MLSLMKYNQVFSLLKTSFLTYFNLNIQDLAKLLIEFYDITMKTKLVVKPGIIAIRFDEKSFFSTILGFNPGWDYKHYNEHIS